MMSKRKFGVGIVAAVFAAYALLAEAGPLAETPPGQPMTFECGVVSGLLPAAAALGTHTNGQGDWSYWWHHFLVRRDMANAMAGSIKGLAQSVSDRILRMQVEELARDILAAPQSGYGDVSYWLRVAADQDRVFARVADRVRNLKEAVCSPSGAPAAR